MRSSSDHFPAGLLLPALCLIFLAWGLPLLFAFWLSGTNAISGTGGEWIGAENFIKAFQDLRFLGSLFVTAIFATGAAVFNVGAGLALAVTFRRNSLARAFTQTALLLPWVLSELAAALIWSGLLDQGYGLFNVLAKSHFGISIPFRTSAVGAMSALWLANLWRGLALSAMLQMAGLASLPQRHVWAARLDGASAWLTFRSIIWPHQARVIKINALLIFLSSATSFSLPFALTGGNPFHATELVALYAYDSAFGSANQLGYAAAQGVIVLGIYLALGTLLIRLRRRVV